MRSLLELAERSGHDLGVFQAQEGRHDDIRHNGRSYNHPERNNLAFAGLAVDINEIDHCDIGTGSIVNPAVLEMVRDVLAASQQTTGLREVIGPTARLRRLSPTVALTAIPYSEASSLWNQHQNHLHVAAFSKEGR